MNGCSFSYTRPAHATRFRVLLTVLIYAVLLPAVAAADSALQARIEFQVQHEPDLDGTEVRIVTDEGNVVMTGHVRLLSQKLLYEQIAWQTRGTNCTGS